MVGGIPFGDCSPTHNPLLQAPVIQEFSGKVVGVKDGDTIVVLHDGKGETIRLYGVDAPEKKQDFGTKAKQFVSDLIFNHDVLVKTHGKDRYGRTIGEVFFNEGQNLNHEIVKYGMGWWYEQYSPHDEDLKKLQNEAQVNKVGLWSMNNPVPPWNFRKSKKKTNNS